MLKVKWNTGKSNWKFSLLRKGHLWMQSLCEFEKNFCNVVHSARRVLTDWTWSCRSFFSFNRVTIFSSSSFLFASDLASSSLVFWNSSFMVAISFSVSALFSRGLILKKSFIQGQCLTFMKARMLYWMQKMDSLKFNWYKLDIVWMMNEMKSWQWELEVLPLQKCSLPAFRCTDERNYIWGWWSRTHGSFISPHQCFSNLLCIRTI